MAGGRVSRAGWASQPQYPVQIDWENPDTRGLRFFYAGSMPVDLVTGQTATIVGGAAPRTVNAGQGAAIGPDISGTSYLDFGTRESWNTNRPMTLFWRGMLDGTTGAFRCPISKANGNGGTTTPFDMQIDSATGAFVVTRSNVAFRQNVSTTTATAGIVNSVCYVAETELCEGQTYFYVNSATRENGSSIDSGTGVPTANTNSLRIGRREDGGTQLDGAPEVTMLWGRALSTEEYGRVFRNPYSLLKSVRRRTGIIYGAGGAAFNPAWARGSNQLIGSGLHVS